MPFLPQSVPSLGIAISPVSPPAGYEFILPVLGNYRRIIEYFSLLASNPGLLQKGLSSGPVEKCLRAIDDCEELVINICGRLEREVGKRKELIAKLDKGIAATRSLLDMEIRKHADQTGVAIVACSKDGLDSSLETIQTEGINGNPSAVFMAVDIDSAPSAKSITVQFQNQRIQEIPLVAGGLNPFAVDFIMGQVPEDAKVLLTYGDNKLVLPVCCKVTPPAILSARIMDEKSNQPLACRVHLTDAYGKFHAPLGARVTTIPNEWGNEKWNTNYRFSNQPFFYCSGEFQIELPPGKYMMRVVRGFEHEVQEISGEVVSGETKQIDVLLKRIADMPSMGWHAGQTHVHSQNLMPVNDHSGWEIIPDAEGLEVSFLSVFQQFEEIFTEEYPVGLIRHFSRDNYYLVVGEEFRHVPFGHMTFLNLKEIVPPISSGRLGGKNWPDTPCNAQAIDIAHEQGAVACYCHFDARGPIVINDELPIDAALGKVDCGEVMGAGGGYKYWYPMLNCGIRIGACAGPDWNIEDCCRVYVYTGKKDFTFQEWMDGLRAQRTFVTSGPMLFMTVNDQLPGSIIKGQDAGKLSIHGRVLSTMPIQKIEILVNGQVVDSVESSGDARELHIQRDLISDKNCWVALRCFGQGAAHTSPVYVEVNDEPMGTREDARELLAISEQCLRWTEREGIFPSAKDREEVLAIFREGVEFYQRIMDRG